MGRIAAIAAAAIVGIASLPALLGGDAPPPVPADVGVAPPATGAPPAPPPVAPVVVAPPSDDAPAPPRLAKRRRAREPAHPLKERTRPRHHRPQEVDPAPPPPVHNPPVYSYVPPPSPGEFHIER